MKILAIRGDNDKCENILDLLSRIGGINENNYNCCDEL
jgi:hypothetical protein